MVQLSNPFYTPKNPIQIRSNPTIECCDCSVVVSSSSSTLATEKSMGNWHRTSTTARTLTDCTRQAGSSELGLTPSKQNKDAQSLMSSSSQLDWTHCFSPMHLTARRAEASCCAALGTRAASPCHEPAARRRRGDPHAHLYCFHFPTTSCLQEIIGWHRVCTSFDQGVRRPWGCPQPSM